MRRGFTVLELTIVVAIIGALASVVMVLFGEARMNSRDAKRVSDMRQLQHGLNLYFADHSVFPIFTTETTIIGVDEFSLVLTSGDYMAGVPKDPSPDYNYTYISNTSGTEYQLSFCLEGDSIQGYTAGCGNIITP